MAGPFPTTTTTTCAEKYTSVTLAAGEKFVLPPGATLISASNINAITDDGCLDRTQLEELECYALVLTASENAGTLSGDNPWTSDKVRISKVTINNIDYTVDSPSNPGGDGDWFFIDKIQTAINSNPAISGLFSDFNISFAASTSDADGGLGSICFRTIPSIGNNMTVTVVSEVSTIQNISLEIKVHPRSYYTATTFSGMCECETLPLDLPAAVPLPSAISAPVESPVETTTVVETPTTTTTTTEPDVPTVPSV